jgi:hypothetical protein
MVLSLQLFYRLTLSRKQQREKYTPMHGKQKMVRLFQSSTKGAHTQFQ